MGTRRLTLRQRGWLAHETLRVFGPFRDVDAVRLRRALASLHRADPGNPAVCLIDGARGRWIRQSTEEFAVALDTVVRDVASSGEPAEDLRRVATAMEIGSRTVVFAVCDGFVAMRANHAAGDGGTLVRLLANLITAASAGADVTPPRSVRAPLLRAALRFYGRDPRRIVRTLSVERPAGTAPGSHATVPWQPRPAAVVDRSDSDLMSRIRRWRDAEMPGMSTAAIIIAALAGALEAEGIRMDAPGMYVLVDGRRYLAPGTVVSGNFAVGQFLAPADPTDPREISRVLRDAIDAGRPLSTLGICDVKTLLRGTPRDVDRDDRITADPPASLAVSYFPASPVLRELPWDGVEEGRRVCAIGLPGGPNGISVSATELGGTLHLAASFHSSTYAEAAVAKAIRRVLIDPTGPNRSAG